MPDAPTSKTRTMAELNEESRRLKESARQLNERSVKLNEEVSKAGSRNSVGEKEKLSSQESSPSRDLYRD